MEVVSRTRDNGSKKRIGLGVEWLDPNLGVQCVYWTFMVSFDIVVG